MTEPMPPTEYYLNPGYLVIPRSSTIVSGVVGSSVFVSLWDHARRYSGCCCFQHPRSSYAGNRTVNTGDVALPHLISSMHRIGSQTDNLRAHVIGGSVADSNRYGERNRNVAFEILDEHQIEVLSEDTGGPLGRKFIYNSETGENVVMKVHKLRQEDWYPYSKQEETESGGRSTGEPG
ncbi:MAG: chemotaxis protein CheD [Candidatus Cloacimonetes bacterium]|nr:chemotaxis protein CheD [Candidatus Cloacimonadota bacterium]